MSIRAMSRSVQDYLAGFDLIAIAVTRDGRLISTRVPAGATAAWWCEASKAGAMIRAAQRNGGDVVAAAHRLEVPLTEHAAVVARVEVALGRIDAGIDQARRIGQLAQVNAEYHHRRRRAQQRGEKFIPYNVVLQRLRATMAGVAAGGAPPKDLNRAGVR